jgi:hypothetical protein
MTAESNHRKAKMGHNSGILFVTMQPKDIDYPIYKFHDWYNNEHGPNRLRLSFFKNGFRYKAVDGLKPEWMAIYDVDDMETLTTETYTRLRAPPVQSQRERDVMKELIVDRRFYDFGSEQKKESFKRLEDINNADEHNVLVVARITLQDDSKRHLYEEWFDKEHVPMLSKVPGWRRSRRFVNSTLEQHGELQVLAIHEYDPENGLGGEEFQAPISTPWRDQIFQEVVTYLELHRGIYFLRSNQRFSPMGERRYWWTAKKIGRPLSLSSQLQTKLLYPIAWKVTLIRMLQP